MIRNIAVLKKDTIFFTCFGKSMIFQLFTFVFLPRHGSTESFILVLSPLNARSVHEAKLFAGQQSNANGRLSHETEIKDIKQAKYPIICGHPEAIVVKLYCGSYWIVKM